MNESCYTVAKGQAVTSNVKEKEPICSQKQKGGEKGVHIDGGVMTHINQGTNSAAEPKKI